MFDVKLLKLCNITSTILQYIIILYNIIYCELKFANLKLLPVEYFVYNESSSSYTTIRHTYTRVPINLLFSEYLYVK